MILYSYYKGKTEYSKWIELNCNGFEWNALLHFCDFFCLRRYLANYFFLEYVGSALVHLDCKLNTVLFVHVYVIFPLLASYCLASLQCVHVTSPSCCSCGVHVVLRCYSRRHRWEMLLTLRLLLKFIFDRVNSQNLRKKI